MEIIEIISYNQESNTYVVKNGETAVIIDCGASVEKLKNLGITAVSAILLTHGHFDHIVYLKDYIKEFNCKVYASENIVEKLQDASKNLSQDFYHTPFKFDKKTVEKVSLVSNETLEISGIKIECVTLPGHCECQMGYIIDNKLFSGDVIFSHCIGRYDLYDSSFLKVRKSLEKVKKLNVEKIYPGHGMPFNK